MMHALMYLYKMNKQGMKKIIPAHYGPVITESKIHFDFLSKVVNCPSYYYQTRASTLNSSAFSTSTLLYAQVHES